jgi:hypothetical protein
VGEKGCQVLAGDKIRYEVGTLHLLGFDIITHFKLLLMVLQIGSSFWAGTFCFQATRQEVHMPSTAWIPQNTPEVAETHAQTETAP